MKRTNYTKHKRIFSGEALEELKLTKMTEGSTVGSDPKALQEAFEKPSVKASLGQLSKLIAKARLDLKDFSDGLEYSGFDREKIGAECAERFGAKGTAKLILLGVKRGTRIDKILRTSVSEDPEVKAWFDSGKIKAGGKGPKVITVGRILACFPDCAVLIARRYGVKGKFTIPNCPPELQFPAAASLPMSAVVRTAHIEFCKRFGDLIKKPFDPNFYEIAFNSMIQVKMVDKSILDVLGNPNDKDARAFDIRAALGFGGVSVNLPQPQSVSSTPTQFYLGESSQTAPEDLDKLFG